jgi:hypothetical protein
MPLINPYLDVKIVKYPIHVLYYYMKELFVHILFWYSYDIQNVQPPKFTMFYTTGSFFQDTMSHDTTIMDHYFLPILHHCNGRTIA